MRKSATLMLFAALIAFGPASARTADSPEAAGSPTPVRVSRSLGGNLGVIEQTVDGPDGTRVRHGLQVTLGPEGRVTRTEVYDAGFLTNRDVYLNGRELIRQEFAKAGFPGRAEDGYELVWNGKSPSETFAEGWRKGGRRWDGAFLVVELAVKDFEMEVHWRRNVYREGTVVASERVAPQALGIASGAAEEWTRLLLEDMGPDLEAP